MSLSTLPQMPPHHQGVEVAVLLHEEVVVHQLNTLLQLLHITMVEVPLVAVPHLLHITTAEVLQETRAVQIQVAEERTDQIQVAEKTDQILVVERNGVAVTVTAVLANTAERNGVVAVTDVSVSTAERNGAMVVEENGVVVTAEVENGEEMDTEMMAGAITTGMDKAGVMALTTTTGVGTTGVDLTMMDGTQLILSLSPDHRSVSQRSIPPWMRSVPH